MVQAEQTIRNFMKRDPLTISRDLTVENARERMETHKIRHLPVVHRGRLVGVISDRDVARAEAATCGDIRSMRVEEAMTPDPYVCHPDESLRRVVNDMAERRLGCAVVVECDRIVGMFTTIDALHRLAGLCDVVEMIARAG